MRVNFDKDEYFQMVILFLLVSLGIHLLLFFGLSRSLQVPIADQDIELEILYRDLEQRKKTFVTDPDPEKTQEELDLEKLKVRADHLSRLTQRVKEQMVAQKSGLTRNRSPKDLVLMQPPKPLTARGKKELRKIEKGLLGQKGDPKSREWSPKGASPAQSTISEHIPQVKQGGFTALNTDSFTYYGFFSRVNNNIRWPWETRVEGFLNHLTRQNLHKVAEEVRRTIVEITLDELGHYEKGLVLKSSGVEAFDQAALQAFQQVQAFPNPPEPLIEEDGKVRLTYTFFVEIDSNWIAFR